MYGKGNKQRLIISSYISSVNGLNKTKMNIIASLCTELLIEMTPPPFCLGPSLPPPTAVQRLP